jgi:hypothetical protein
MRRIIVAALLAASVAVPAATVARDSGPAAQSPGDQLWLSVTDNASPGMETFGVNVEINTMGPVDCRKPVTIDASVRRGAKINSWSLSETICPEASYRVRVRADLTTTTSWSSPAKVTVTYPAATPKTGKKGKTRKPASVSAPIIIEMVQDRYRHENRDNCVNVGTLGSPVTCETAIGAGRG